MNEDQSSVKEKVIKETKDPHPKENSVGICDERRG